MAKKDDMSGLGATFYKEGIGGALKTKKPEAKTPKASKKKAPAPKVPLPRPRPDFVNRGAKADFMSPVNRGAKSDALKPVVKKASGGAIRGNGMARVKTKGRCI